MEDYYRWKNGGLLQMEEWGTITDGRWWGIIKQILGTLDA
jgi:hypothetical protein